MILNDADYLRFGDCISNGHNTSVVIKNKKYAGYNIVTLVPYKKSRWRIINLLRYYWLKLKVRVGLL
jgi:hypothetical protein